MPKVKIDYDEYYPIYFIAENSYYTINESELSEGVLNFIRKANDDFWTAQEILRNAFMEANGGYDR